MTELTHTETTAKGKRYPILDLVRFIAAMLVIFIHIFPEGSTTASIGLDSSVPMLLTESFVHAILRPATPIFFLISGFLLFQRINAEQSSGWKRVGHFCLRLLFLYLFWYVVALPLTVKDIVDFIGQGDTQGLIHYFVITLWKGAPRGFWFLVSLALSVVIANLFRGKKGIIALCVIAGVLYAYGCLNSAYFGIFTAKEDSFSKTIAFIGNYLELSYCVLEALLFVTLGKFFALYGPKQIKGNIVFIVLAFLLMVGELFLTLFFGWHVYPDAYFSLPIFVCLLMNFLLNLHIESPSFARVAKKLKNVGSFSYLFHVQFFVYLHWIFDASGYNVFRVYIALLLVPYVICVLLSFGLQTAFESLSKYRPLRFLRYSY